MVGRHFALGCCLAMYVGFCCDVRSQDAVPGLQDRNARQLEHLSRGLVAIPTSQRKVFVSWRLLATDPTNIAFNLYRQSSGDQPIQLNTAPIATTTCFEDDAADLTRPTKYFVRSVVKDGREADQSTSFTIQPDRGLQPYLALPLQTLPGHTPNDASVGDLDGDGDYEIILKQQQRPRDNSQRGLTGTTKLEAYRLDGQFLWRIDLGINIREGAHYTPFLVYDFDSDGQAEIMCKTADGTVDGQGTVIGQAGVDHRNSDGYVLEGPEFLTVFAGSTGQALATVDYLPPRGIVSQWGDNYGNRVDRFLAGVAYLDGQRPSAVFCRGYYTRSVVVAWDWRDGKLTERWTFDTSANNRGLQAYEGQGNHSLSIADVDDDGRDDVIYGACCIASDGRGLYSTGLGHGDALHVSDLSPEHAGLEVFGIHERRPLAGVTFRDAKSGAVLWSKASADVGRGLCCDIDPRHHGAEFWAAGAELSGLWNIDGEIVSQRRPRSCNFAIWWDGDPLRELLNGTTISKWDWAAEEENELLSAAGCAANNSSKSTPSLSADIFGDWREEVIWRSADNRELRIYSTTIPTELRLPTLMHDAQYRVAIAWQNVGYNQPPHPSFFFGDRMQSLPAPRIVTRPLPQ